MNHVVLSILLSKMAWMDIIFGAIAALPIVLFLLVYFVGSSKYIFGTFGQENSIMYLKHGSGGEFARKIIFPSKTHAIGSKSFDILPKDHEIFTNGEERPISQPPSIAKLYLFLWPFYQVHLRWQEWQEWQLINGERILVTRKELTPYLFFKPTPYGMFLKDAEDQNEMPLDIKFTIIVQATNALKPVWENEDAMSQLEDYVKAEALLFIRQQEYAEFAESADEIKNIFSEKICSLNEKIPGVAKNIFTSDPSSKKGKGLVALLGFKIISAQLEEISVGGDNKLALQQASVKPYIAEREAKAAIEEAEGKMQASKKASDAKAYDMEVRRKFYNDIKDMPHAQSIELAKEVAGENSHLTTLVTGQNVLPSINISEKPKEKEE